MKHKVKQPSKMNTWKYLQKVNIYVNKIYLAIVGI